MDTEQYPVHCMIWVGLHYKAGIIGPIFCDEYADPSSQKKTLTSKGYKRLLEEALVPELKEKLSREDFSQAWFQQDGASIHTT